MHRLDGRVRGPTRLSAHAGEHGVRRPTSRSCPRPTGRGRATCRACCFRTGRRGSASAATWRAAPRSRPSTCARRTRPWPMHTPGRPVRRPYTSAITPACASSRTSTVPDLVTMVEQRVVDRHGGTTRHAEDVVDASGDQRPHDRLGGAHVFGQQRCGHGADPARCVPPAPVRASVARRRRPGTQANQRPPLTSSVWPVIERAARSDA